MLSTNGGVAYVYNPERQSEQELIESFVIRREEFADLLRELKTASMTKPEQHFIVQGVRGSGKTTLLLRLYYAIRSDRELMRNVIAVRFPEEQYNIRTPAGIWETALELVEHDPEHAELRGAYQRILDIPFDSDYEDKAFAVFRDVFRAHGKKLILFIDNFGELLNKFADKDIRRLREILITNPDVRIVGGSAVTMEHFYGYDKPFYNFFDIVQLRGLGQGETLALLRKLAEGRNDEHVRRILENEPEKVEILRRLTGGIPRTLVLLFEVFADDRDGNPMRNLELLLDRVTPLYKHRMDDLSPHQQAIVDAIALAWDAVGVKYIADRVRMESKAVSAQLGLLERNWIVEKETTSTKNHLYRIHERFFNIWYLMRNSRRGEREKIAWLVRFLESWCSKEELVPRADKLIRFDLPDSQQCFTGTVLSETRELPEELRVRLMQKLCDAEKGGGKADISEEIDQDDFDSLLAVADTGNTEAMFLLGCFYRDRGDTSEAESWWLKAAEEGNADAMYFLGDVYRRRGDAETAETWLFRAAESGNVDAMYFRGAVYWNRSQTAIAEIWWLKAAERYAHYYCPLALLALQQNDEEKSVHYASSFFEGAADHIPVFLEAIQSYFALLIAHGAYSPALHLFRKFDLKDKLRPMYYALMHYMKDEFPDEYKKMGEEIKQTVEEIVTEIDRLQKELKEKKQAN